jgi:hypothetical protein
LPSASSWLSAKQASPQSSPTQSKGPGDLGKGGFPVAFRDVHRQTCRFSVSAESRFKKVASISSGINFENCQKPSGAKLFQPAREQRLAMGDMGYARISLGVADGGRGDHSESGTHSEGAGY